MNNFFNFLADNWISLLVLIVCIITLFVSVNATRYQIIALLNSQLADKAKECNSYLYQGSDNYFPTKPEQVSGIVSSIITAEELLYLRLNRWNKYFSRKQWRFNLLTRNINDQALIDQFYLQIHTTIRVKFKDHNSLLTIPDEMSGMSEEDRNINDQYLRARRFLWISLVKCDNRDFEKQHLHTKYRIDNAKISSLFDHQPASLFMGSTRSIIKMNEKNMEDYKK